MEQQVILGCLLFISLHSGTSASLPCPLPEQRPLAPSTAPSCLSTWVERALTPPCRGAALPWSSWPWFCINASALPSSPQRSSSTTSLTCGTSPTYFRWHFYGPNISGKSDLRLIFSWAEVKSCPLKVWLFFPDTTHTSVSKKGIHILPPFSSPAVLLCWASVTNFSLNDYWFKRLHWTLDIILK